MTNSCTFLSSVGGDNSTVTDDSNATTGLGNGGHRVRFVPALSQTVAVAANTVTQATNAAASAAASAASAASAVLSTSTSMTSTTSLAIPTSGLPVSKVFTTQAGKTVANGMTFKATSDSSPTNWMLGTVTYSGTTLTMTVTNSNGSGTFTDWTISLSAPILTTTSNSVTTKSANYTLVSADKGSIYSCTSTFTFSYTAAATLGNGWYIYFKNDGAGIITHDPNAAETIEGTTTVTQQPGELFLVVCDGANLQLYRLVSKKIFYSARTSNTILGPLDNAYLLDITSGTFTQTFTAAAALGTGWYCWIRNSGTGDITLDPNAAETIDGLTSYIMYPGEVRFVQCDGSVFRTYVIAGFSKTFTSSGAFTKPPGYAYFDGLAWSGGSSGQRSNNVALASIGGAGGGCFPFVIQSSTVGTTETVTIGAGGLAVTTVASGNVGGTTSLGALVTVYGSPSFTVGGSALSGAVSATSGAPNNFEGGGGFTVSSAGFYGGGSPSGNASGNGGACLYGGAPGGSLDASAVLRTAGTSVYGGSGGAGSSVSNGTAGTAPGGGGGATQTGTSSGAGARGELRIRGIV